MNTRSLLALVLLLLAVGTAGCGDGDDGAGAGSTTAPATPPSATASAAPPASTAPASTAQPSPSPAAMTVGLSCQANGDDGIAAQIEVPHVAGKPDFTRAWADDLALCSVEMVNGVPDSVVLARSDIEKKALQASGNGVDVGPLYETCAETDPGVVDGESGSPLAEEDVAELNAALILCPKHRQAGDWRRALAEEQQRKAGRLFDDGLYRVGKEIKPGTYESTEGISGCYWERQDRNGEIIDNNFANNAKRVQVTIRSSDYGFETEGCGTWRPVN